VVDAGLGIFDALVNLVGEGEELFDPLDYLGVCS